MQELKQLPASHFYTVRERHMTMGAAAHDLIEKLGQLDFDVQKLFCVKTGQPIGKRNWPQFYALARVCSTEKDAPQFAFLATMLRENSCAAHWLKTDGSALDHLMIADPIGYFIYAASFLLQNRNIPKQEKEYERQKLFRDKILAFAEIANMLGHDPENDIFFLHDELTQEENKIFDRLTRANEYMRKVLALDPKSLDLPFQNLAQITKIALRDDDFFSVLSERVNNWIENKRYILANFDKAASNKGPGQFRAQKWRVSARSSDTDRILVELAEFGLGPDQFELVKEPTVAKSWTGAREDREKRAAYAQMRKAEKSQKFSGKRHVGGRGLGVAFTAKKD